MVTWTLVILTALAGESWDSGGSYSAASVPGFTTEQACLNASKKVYNARIRPFNHSDTIITMECVALSL